VYRRRGLGVDRSVAEKKSEKCEFVDTFTCASCLFLQLRLRTQYTCTMLLKLKSSILIVESTYMNRKLLKLDGYSTCGRAFTLGINCCARTDEVSTSSMYCSYRNEISVTRRDSEDIEIYCMNRAGGRSLWVMISCARCTLYASYMNGIVFWISF